MDLMKYLDTLPGEILANSEFCVTRHGDKQPFDPFKKITISAKDRFYSVFELAELNLEEYDTIGIKVQKHFSTIDIDHCVDNGVLNQQAIDVINMIQGYTEISPSGTGIRILFVATNKFDRDAYKIKNSKNGLEYYDGPDQQEKGARMVRLSGNRIFPEYNFREVDTTEFLDKYMERDVSYRQVEQDTTEANMQKCFFIGEFLKKDYSIYDIYYRHMSTLSESEWDLMLVNRIFFYTRNINEVRYIFEHSTYFKKKKNEPPKFHINKWFNTGYAENVLAKAYPEPGNGTVSLYSDLFDEFNADESATLDPGFLVKCACSIGFVKPSYFKQVNIDDIPEYSGQDTVNHLMWVARHRKTILQDLKFLLGGK